MTGIDTVRLSTVMLNANLFAFSFFSCCRERDDLNNPPRRKARSIVTRTLVTSSRTKPVALSIIMKTAILVSLVASAAAFAPVAQKVCFAGTFCLEFHVRKFSRPQQPRSRKCTCPCATPCVVFNAHEVYLFFLMLFVGCQCATQCQP